MRTGEPTKIGLLTQKEYDWLKQSDDLSESEKEKIEEFEKLNKESSLDVNVTERKKIKITRGLLWKYFKLFYKHETGKEFIETPDSLKNIGVLLSYFASDDKFFKSDRLREDLNKASLSKSLLIIGKYGNGKTSILKTFQRMFDHYRMPMKFKLVNAHDLVSEWESLETQGDKHLFFEKYLCSHLCIDDVKKEDKASNYGLKEIVGKILEKRYDKKRPTIITCNFRENDEKGDFMDAVQEFNRYGNHIVDRLFETHNFIEFKGKSFR